MQKGMSMTTRIPEEMLEEITGQGYRWVLAMRDRFGETARPLSAGERQAVAGHFEPETLALARIAETREIEEPGFVDRWRREGVPDLLDFRQVAGIVFVDTIVIATRVPHGGSRWLSLLFHELIHVAQWRLLSPQGMIREYVQGWAANGFAYDRIPVEVQAYRLQRAFDRDGPAFSVEERVRERFGLKRG